LVLGVATVVFFVVNLAPGDPALRLLSPGMTAEVAEQVRANYGLDEPLHIQYVKWMGSALTGDFGSSFTHHRPVLDVILGFLPNTLLLSGLALLLAFLVGIVLGTLQAVRQYSVLDSGASVVTLFFYSMPSFWLALMMILVFSYFAQVVWQLPIHFPASGLMSADYADLSAGSRFLDRLHHLVLPVVSLALVLTAGIARFMRGSMLEVIRQDFVRTARAKGLPERSVVFKHALRNALLPIISLLGLYIPVLFSGTVFVEEVFAWPGMGRALLDSVRTLDYPMVMGLSLFFAIMVVLGNLLADVLYAAVDPRIRYE
jgi:peptide/nickel transport system permease protein